MEVVVEEGVEVAAAAVVGDAGSQCRILQVEL